MLLDYICLGSTYVSFQRYGALEEVLHYSLLIRTTEYHKRQNVYNILNDADNHHWTYTVTFN